MSDNRAERGKVVRPTTYKVLRGRGPANADRAVGSRAFTVQFQTGNDGGGLVV